MPKQIAGIGVGLRREYAKELACTERQIDFIEVMPENWVCFGGRRRQQLEACVERFPSVTHSVSLNIGGMDPLDGELLDATSALLKRLEAPFFTDHVCYSSVRGQPISDLLPLPFTREVIEHTAARIVAARERVGCPLALENATFYSHMPGAEMDEASFLCQLLEAGDCGMLLDVNNVYVNSQNHGFDARAFIDRMPLDRVWQLHLAGHTLVDDTIIDTHIGPIIEPVWDLYRYTLRRARRLIPTLIEWDQDIPSFDAVVDEVDRARAAAQQALGKETP
ncbi:MAG TPA: DUF692 domain-containing protein [Pseudomonadota bacterium]|nr:DUF692 domain-containing protein [Pseudomonadota bacterium]